MDKEKKLTAEQARKIFDYDANDGYLRWRQPGLKRTIGKIAGYIHTAEGYRIIALQKDYKVTRYKAHRLIWLWVYGEWPPDTIDHINMDRTDNRLANLRLATRSENKRNMRVRKDSGTGLKGVYKKKNYNRWHANITVHGKRQSLGWFGTPKEAHAAYCEAAKSLHGEFARGA